MSDAISPCSHKSSKIIARRSIWGAIWGHFGRQVAQSLTSDAVFFEVRFLVEKRCLTQSPRAHKSPEKGGEGPLKNSQRLEAESLEAGGWGAR